MGLGQIQLSPPADDEIECSLLGPNIGECVVVHIGSNHWIIVDSCLDNATGRPAALVYLEAMRVPPSAVDLIVATHWHDDHISGLCDMLAACKNAQFCTSAVLSQEEFVGSIFAYNTEPLTVSGSGVREMYRIINLLRERDDTVLRALGSRMIKDWGTDLPYAVEAWTLSPSDAGFNRFIASALRIMPAEKTTKCRAPLVLPNDASVVIQVVVGPISMLLGADLEVSTNIKLGWSAVLSDRARPKARSKVFKVPHHGSENGHHAEVWNSMLEPDPIAILAPYSRPPKLPRKTDVDRIIALSPQSYSASIVASKRTKAMRSSEVEKMIKDLGFAPRPIEMSPGVVRTRWTPQAGWTTELFNGAVPLTALRNQVGPACI